MTITGDPANRVDILLVSEGYRSSELPTFAANVNSFVSDIFLQEPYREYRNYVNIRRLEFPSQESGADHPESGMGIYRNTAFDATYNCAGIQRLICVNNSKVADAISVLPANQQDIVVIIVNDPVYGGSGGAYAVASTNGAAVELVLHETGHSFAELADEYTSQPPSCEDSYEPPEVNATRETARNAIKWTTWIDAATPIPTFTTAPGVPGLYQGAKYCPSTLYRPTQNSKMRSLGPPFEQINAEQHVKRIYAYVSPIDSVSPATPSLTINQGGTQLFSVSTPVPQTHSLQTTWRVDGAVQGTSATFTLDSALLTTGSHQVSVEVRDVTPMVREDPEALLEELFTWTVEVGGLGLPPGAPTQPSPVNNATAVILAPTLAWVAGSQAASHDVYFGASPNPPFADDVTSTTYVPGPLATGTKYYWRVMAKNIAGATSSPTWSFRTKTAPDAPSAPSPANGSTRVSWEPRLEWTLAAGATSYDIYFGASSPPPFKGDSTAANYSPGALRAETKYFWRVVARSATGSKTSPTWSFTTGSGQTSAAGVFLDGWWYLDIDGNGIWESGMDRASLFGWPGTLQVVGDWNGDGRQKIGVFHEGFWYLDWNGNGVWDGFTTDRGFGFGWAGVTPVVGDWNGNGKTKVGVFKDGWWYLDLNGNGQWEAGVDWQSNFGWPGVTPLVADWNGDGKTEIGVFKDGSWYLDYNGNGAWDGFATDRGFEFGWPGVTPIVGDWNGDGKAEAGAFIDGWWYLDLNGNGIWETGVDRQSNFGWPGVTPLVGDWNGDGKTKVAVFNDGSWYLDSNGNGVWDGFAIDKGFGFGWPGVTPVVGRW